MKALVERGADLKVEVLGHFLLTYVAAWGSSDVLEYLLINQIVTIEIATNGRTPLSWAVCSEDALKKVILLLDYGADKNEKDMNGDRAYDNICDRTYLGISENDKKEMIKLLE